MASELGPSYQPIFHLSLEIPAFFMSYRWWEDEATPVFWAFDILEISRVIRFGLFRDENFPRTSLRARRVDTIYNFLFAMSQPHEHQLLGSLSHMQRVEEILRRSSIAPFDPIPWNWLPLESNQSLDARAIAAAIETESHFQFRQIGFEELVRASLGYRAINVEWFLQQHTALYIILLEHLKAYPEDIPLYTEVEKHLRSRSPFAHRALVQSLLAVRPGNCNMAQPNAGFDFIAGPIQRLFKDETGRLAAMLKMLSVLAIRFRRQYMHASTMDWKTPFDTSVPFLEDCLISTSGSDLARSLKALNEHQFAEVTRQNLVAEDAVIGNLLWHWQMLSVSVWECCSALPDLIPHIQECTQNLLTARDYHSLTAIVNGLYNYTISTMQADGPTITLEALTPPEIGLLLNPVQNYASYRKHYNEQPGIPFLVPHLRDYKQNGESVLQSVFQYLQRSR
ncbi:hypothetical protein PENARI_c006G04320 [Penicillium arizonense]|uniref:Ras-GEF domain-containing protein n=1 Tax=Penicillium arizonense TaxID=1835702 RepID=A0A1F5LN88_PENAI|nr:hypothetical protein PENARI_c006G04320 [Penicillium arizonense]OGE54381.1 hypothetical protein PENARI_c006G04320 [Penicillium arizonense]